jgi:hypothetical protein
MPTFLILLSITIVFGWVGAKLFHGLRTMEIQMGVGVVLRRYESPLLFWAVIAIQCLVLGIEVAIIYLMVFILPNQIMS